MVIINILNKVLGKVVSYPHFFNFYINSIIDDISSLQVGCRLSLTRINIILYADDVVLLANSLEDENLIHKKLKFLVGKIKMKINEKNQSI